MRERGRFSLLVNMAEKKEETKRFILRFKFPDHLISHLNIIFDQEEDDDDDNYIGKMVERKFLNHENNVYWIEQSFDVKIERITTVRKRFDENNNLLPLGRLYRHLYVVSFFFSHNSNSFLNSFSFTNKKNGIVS